jgi:pathogenesis-related protein 1
MPVVNGVMCVYVVAPPRAFGGRARDVSERLIRRHARTILRPMVRAVVLGILLSSCGGGEGGGNIFDARGGVGEPAELIGITLYHNEIRQMVDTNGIAAGQLPALEWDDSLAATAAAWVAQCKDSDGDGLVDHNAGRSTGHPYYVGENIYASTGAASAHDAVYGWASEGVNYHYSSNICDAGRVCGHYTQLVWRTTQKVGCAPGDCPSLRYRHTIVCDYGPGGNVNNQRPY